MVISREVDSEHREITIEDIYDALGNKEGEEFARVMMIVDDIIDNPNKYTGHQALRSAAVLAAHRTRISLRAQLYKTTDKSIVTRRRKDLLMSMYQALEENINTLKLLGKMDNSTSAMERV